MPAWRLHPARYEHSRKRKSGHQRLAARGGRRPQTGPGRGRQLRAEALSQLVTIHIKSYIGKLSPLCGCAIASSIGSACGVVYLLGGGLEQIRCVIQNMIADISGLICDGAKSGCALKIASSVASAMQCAQLAMARASAPPAWTASSPRMRKAAFEILGILARKAWRTRIA